LWSREPLNSTVDRVTRRQNGQIDGVIRSSIRAAACRPMSGSGTATLASVIQQCELAEELTPVGWP
jgi:hypothetical protein